MHRYMIISIVHHYRNDLSLNSRGQGPVTRLPGWRHENMLLFMSLVLCPTTPAGCALSLYCFFILRPTSFSVFKHVQTEWSFSHFQPPNEGRSVVQSQWIFHGDSMEKFWGPSNNRSSTSHELDRSAALIVALHTLLSTCRIMMPVSFKSCGYGPKMVNNGQQMSEWYHNYINMATTDLLTWRSSCSSWSSTSSPPKNDQNDQNDGDQNNLRPELQAMTSGVNCCLSRSRWIKTNDVCSWFGIDYISLVQWYSSLHLGPIIWGV